MRVLPSLGDNAVDIDERAHRATFRLREILTLRVQGKQDERRPGPDDPVFRSRNKRTPRRAPRRLARRPDRQGGRKKPRQ